MAIISKSKGKKRTPVHPIVGIVLISLVLLILLCFLILKIREQMARKAQDKTVTTDSLAQPRTRV